MFTLIAAVVMVVSLLVVLWISQGGLATATVAVVASLTVLPIQIFSWGEASATHTTIAASTLSITSYQAALILAAIIVPGWMVFKGIAPPLLFLPVFLFVVIVAQSNTPPHVLMGVAQWGFVALAWGFGWALSRGVGRGQISETFLAIVLAAAVGAQAIGALMQIVGLSGVSSIEVGPLTIPRISGFAGHSGNLGKILILLVVLLLPLTRSSNRVARNLAIAGTATAFVLVALTFSRANTLAIIGALGIWFVFGPGAGLLRRIVLPAIMVVVAAPVIVLLILRNASDPSGGSRPELLESALVQIGRTFWFGVGPNAYLSTVSEISALAAGGLPVHSALLLAFTELGLVGSVLVAVPIVLVIIGAIMAVRKGGRRGLVALAFIAVLPGLAVIAATGWGLMYMHILLLLMLVVGYASAAAKPWADEEGVTGLKPVGKLSKRSVLV